MVEYKIVRFMQADLKIVKFPNKAWNSYITTVSVFGISCDSMARFWTEQKAVKTELQLST